MSVFFPKALALGLAGAATLALGGCYDDGYGYGGVEAGAGYYGDGYGYGGYGAYNDFGYGYGYPGYGWFDGFYYPGNGYYVYDRGGRRFHMRQGDWQHWRGGEHGYAGGRPGRGGQGGPPPGAPGAGNGPWHGRPGDGRPGYGGNGPGNGHWQRGGGPTQGMAAPGGGQQGQGVAAVPQARPSYSPGARGGFGGRVRGGSRPR